MAYTGRLRPKGELLPGVSMVYERVGISPVEVHEMVGKSAFSVCKKAKRIKDVFYVCAKARLCDLFIFKNSAFTAVKRGAKSQLQVGKWKVYMKRVFA